jgi:hypothetical protein
MASNITFNDVSSSDPFFYPKPHSSAYSSSEWGVVDLVVLDVIILFQDVNGLVLGKIVKDLQQAQKRKFFSLIR